MLDWITQTINSLGYLGIAFLMCLENLFPPIPSEVIMPLSGFVVTQGELQLPFVIFAGVAGSVIGTLPWYFLGRYLGLNQLKTLADKYGQWLGLSGADVENAQAWFHQRGNQAVGFGRLVPSVRTYISIPAGISRMQLVPYLLYSTLGTIVWLTMLAGAGYLLGDNYEQVAQYLAPVSKVVLVVAGVAIGGYFIRRIVRRQT